MFSFTTKGVTVFVIVGVHLCVPVREREREREEGGGELRRESMCVHIIPRKMDKDYVNLIFCHGKM